MSDTTTEATAAFAFVSAMLQELDMRDPGFAQAVFTRIESDISRHSDGADPAVMAYHDELVEGLDLIKADFR